MKIKNNPHEVLESVITERNKMRNDNVNVKLISNEKILENNL